MYDIKQFRPALYLVILMGMTGYAMASESAGLWVIAIAFILTNAWLIKQRQFKPIPRLLANAITLLFAAYAVLLVRNHEGSPILAVGQFLVLLQVVKVWEQRANRDYAQLLVLSLLLMVAAAISTGSLVFGILFIAYLFLSLYCCLLFHLKVETDQAKSALSPTSEHWGDAALKHDQTFLAKSMRRLTGLVAVYALVGAVLTFLLFPRGTGAGMFGQFQWRAADTQTGFSEQVSFNTVARITQNDEAMGTIKISLNDQPLSLPGTLMLRGMTHDYYNGNDTSNNQAAYQWAHLPLRWEEHRGRENAMTPDNNGGYIPHELARENTRNEASGVSWSDKIYRQEITLNPTGTTALFSLPGLVSFKVQDSGNMRRLLPLYFTSDQTLRSFDPVTAPIKYVVETTNTLGSETPPSHAQSNIDPLIGQFVRKPEVAGDLVASRDALVAGRPDKGLFYTSPFDEQIARRIEGYLQHNFSYTLDLTDAKQTAGRDPMVAFLYDFKRGHCEYFAGAMTLMCQSLGMNARLVVGFKCDDYNDFGHFYTLRQSQAHAWVEVLTTDGWKTFDPTSGNETSARMESAWQKTKHFFDFMEYTWQNSVIAYNADNRENLIQAMDSKLNSTAAQSANHFSGIKDAFDKIGNWLSLEVVGPLVVIMVVVLSLGILGAFGYFFFERLKLRRRARRIGIKDLPLSDQAKLVRQLGFYDDLILLLERNKIVRPQHLTPMEFSSSLSFLPGDAYNTIRRLTQLFYKIRYGESEIDDGQRRRLTTVITRLSQTLTPAPRADR